MNSKIVTLGRQSLTQSKKNLDIREKIQIHVNALQILLRKELDILNSIEEQKKFIKQYEKEINSKKNKTNS